MALEPIRQGDTYGFDIEFPPETIDGVSTYTDITGFIFTLTLKSSFDDTDANAVLQHSCIAGQGDNDNATQGYCSFVVPPAKTNVPAGSYYYDVQLDDTKGWIETIEPPVESYKTKIIVVPQVTRLQS